MIWSEIKRLKPKRGKCTVKLRNHTLNAPPRTVARYLNWRLNRKQWKFKRRGEREEGGGRGLEICQGTCHLIVTNERWFSRTVFTKDVGWNELLRGKLVQVRFFFSFLTKTSTEPCKTLKVHLHDLTISGLATAANYVYRREIFACGITRDEII